MYKKNKIDIQKCNRYILIYVTITKLINKQRTVHEYFTYGGYE